MKLLNIYLRERILYIPTNAKTTAGYWMSIDPVFIEEINNKDRIFGAVQSRLLNDIILIPTPTDFKELPVVAKAAKLKSYKAFEKNAFTWSLQEIENGYQILPWVRGEKRGWVPDMGSVIKFSGENALRDAFEKLYTLILEKS